MKDNVLLMEIDKPLYETIHSVQYDRNSRFVHVKLLNNSLPFDLTNKRVILSGSKPDGEEIFNTCKIVEDLVVIEITEDMNAVPGVSEYSLEIYGGDMSLLQTKNFKIKVTPSVRSKKVESRSEVKALTDALSEVQNIDNRFAETNAQLSETKQELSSQLSRISHDITNFKLASELCWTNAIKRCIQNAKAGDKIIFPANDDGYLVNNTNDNYLFLVDKPLHFEGYGDKSKIILNDDIPKDVDIFLVIPRDTSSIEGYYFEKIHITSKNSSKVAKNIIHFDLTDAGKQVRRSYIKNCNICYCNGYSIKLTNPVNDDAFYTNTISENMIWGGVNLERCGDSVNFISNTMAGDNGFDLSMVDGSNTFVFENNNLTSRSGFIIRSGHNIKIINNNFECGYSDSCYENGHIVDIDGELITHSWGLLTIEFRGNNITYQKVTAPRNIGSLRINKARGCIVEGNHIVHNGEGKAITIEVKADFTQIGYNLISSDDIVGSISDSGKNTLYTSMFVNSLEKYARYGVNISDKITNYNVKMTTKTRECLDIFAEDVYIWQAMNEYKTKQNISTQKRNEDGSLEQKVIVQELHDGGIAFPQGVRLKAPNGFYWSVEIDDDGKLMTTRVE